MYVKQFVCLKNCIAIRNGQSWQTIDTVWTNWVNQLHAHEKTFLKNKSAVWVNPTLEVPVFKHVSKLANVYTICPSNTATNPNLSWSALRRPRLPAVALSVGHIVYPCKKPKLLQNRQKIDEILRWKRFFLATLPLLHASVPWRSNLISPSPTHASIGIWVGN
jgi:hypothetical protein